MERFLVLRTEFDVHLANKIARVLEAEDIEVMIEHITIHQGNALASGYRIFVPIETLIQAKQLVAHFETPHSATQALHAHHA
jgi:galactitol-specific phosphotransferase system IIB component